DLKGGGCPPPRRFFETARLERGTGPPRSLVYGRECCESFYYSPGLSALLPFGLSRPNLTGTLWLLCGTECARISSARKQLRGSGSLPVKESLFTITMQFIPARRT